MLPVPLQKVRMRTLEHLLRRDRTPTSVDEGTHAIGIIDVTGDQNFQIIGKTDKSAVKHPVCCAR